MNFAGLDAPEDRADVIAFLRAYSASPADIPEAAPTARPTDPDHLLDPAILAIRGDPAYGAYLSGECTTCHRLDGDATGIPSITGWPVEDFVVAMHAYKNNLRRNPVMNMMASRLSDEEIAALAAYFGDLQ
jgi:cytochrome c